MRKTSNILKLRKKIIYIYIYWWWAYNKKRNYGYLWSISIVSFYIVLILIDFLTHRRTLPHISRWQKFCWFWIGISIKSFSNSPRLIISYSDIYFVLYISGMWRNRKVSKRLLLVSAMEGVMQPFWVIYVVVYLSFMRHGACIPMLFVCVCVYIYMEIITVKTQIF